MIHENKHMLIFGCLLWIMGFVVTFYRFMEDERRRCNVIRPTWSNYLDYLNDLPIKAKFQWAISMIIIANVLLLIWPLYWVSYCLAALEK